MSGEVMEIWNYGLFAVIVLLALAVVAKYRVEIYEIRKKRLLKKRIQEKQLPQTSEQKLEELADNLKDLDKVVKKHSMNHSAAVIIREMRRRLFWGKKYHRASVHNRKFIVQNYIDGLSGDYKVLKYGSKFYSLYRKNRDNDFRASGGAN